MNAPANMAENDQKHAEGVNISQFWSMLFYSIFSSWLGTTDYFFLFFCWSKSIVPVKLPAFKLINNHITGIFQKPHHSQCACKNTHLVMKYGLFPPVFLLKENAASILHFYCQPIPLKDQNQQCVSLSKPQASIGSYERCKSLCLGSSLGVCAHI